MKTTYPGSSYQTMSYDSLGNLLGKVEASGSVLNYTYDTLNRLTKITYPGSTTQAYSYDADSNVLSAVDSSASTLLHLRCEGLGDEPGPTEVVGGHSYPLLYGYDKVGNIVSITYPGGSSITITYDTLNRIETLGSFATIYYNDDDEVSTIKYGNGETTTYSYDGRDRVTQIDVKDGSTKELDLNYTYDGNSNVVGIDLESFEYNWLNQLTYVQGIGSASTTYAYDGAGNMLNQTAGQHNDQVQLRHEQRADLHRQGQLHLRRQREHAHHRERLDDLDVHLRLREPPDAGPERGHDGGPVLVTPGTGCSSRASRRARRSSPTKARTGCSPRTPARRASQGTSTPTGC